MRNWKWKVKINPTHEWPLFLPSWPYIHTTKKIEIGEMIIVLPVSVFTKLAHLIEDGEKEVPLGKLQMVSGRMRCAWHPYHWKRVDDGDSRWVTLVEIIWNLIEALELGMEPFPECGCFLKHMCKPNCFSWPLLTIRSSCTYEHLLENYRIWRQKDSVYYLGVNGKRTVAM